MDTSTLVLVAQELFRRRAAKQKKNPATSAVGEHDQIIKQIDACASILEHAAADHLPLTEADRKFIQDALLSAQPLLNLDLNRTLQTSIEGGSVPKCLHLTHSPGALSYEQVGTSTTFQVRGESYLSNNTKVESKGVLFFQRSVQVVNSAAFCSHVAQQSWCGLPADTEPHNTYLIINYLLPAGAQNIQVVAVYAATPAVQALISSSPSSSEDPSAATTPSTSSSSSSRSVPENESGWQGLVRRLFAREVDTEFCDTRLKLIPSMIEANWAVQMAVGNRPVILGSKISQHYYRGPNYLEIDVDLSTSTVASHILGMVRGLSKKMVVDLGWTIEAQSEEELPEVILCQTRYDHVDLEAGAEV